jgi:hypothetical protein
LNCHVLQVCASPPLVAQHEKGRVVRRLVELRVRITNRLARHLSDQPEGVLRNWSFELGG